MADNAYVPEPNDPDVSATEQTSSDGSGQPTPAPPTAEKKWFIVHTYSGHENKAKLTLLERVRNANLNEYFGDVLVPTESVMEVVKGQRRTTTRKFFPGYMFVQMVLDDRTFHLVKNTPKITGFLGGTKPTPVPPSQIAGVQTNMTEGKAKPKARQGKVLLVNAGLLVAKGKPKNFLAPEHIDRIAEVMLAWKEEEKLSRIVPLIELVKNDYNLSPSRYIHTSDADTYRPIPQIVEELIALEAKARQTDAALNEILTNLGI